MIQSRQTAKAIIDALRFHNIAPHATFTSASGSNHGYVEAWNIDDGHDRCVVAFGDNGQTDHEIVDNDAEDEDLAAWLLTDGTGDNDLERVAVRGPDCLRLPAAGKVKIIRHRHMHDSCGNGDEFDVLGGHDWDSATVYPSPSCAKAAIEAECPAGETYRLAHNEYARPHYYIVAAEG